MLGWYSGGITLPIRNPQPTHTWAGFVYVGFVLDCYSKRIVAWHASTSKTPLVLTIEEARSGLRRDRQA